jgi:hypothetical protein
MSMRLFGGTSTPMMRAIKLSLPLLVAFVAANDANDALALNDFAVFAKFLY